MAKVFYLTLAHDEPEKMVAAISSGAAAELISDYGLFLVSTPAFGAGVPCNVVHWAHHKRYEAWNSLWASVYTPQMVQGFVFLLPKDASPFAVNDIVTRVQRCVGAEKVRPYCRAESRLQLTSEVESLAICLLREDEDEDEPKRKCRTDE